MSAVRVLLTTRHWSFEAAMMAAPFTLRRGLTAEWAVDMSDALTRLSGPPFDLAILETTRDDLPPAPLVSAMRIKAPSTRIISVSERRAPMGFLAENGVDGNIPATASRDEIVAVLSKMCTRRSPRFGGELPAAA